MLRSLVYDRLRLLASPRVRRWFKSRSWFVPVSRAIFGNAVYSRSYYADLERIEGSSVETISAWVVENLVPRRIVDVGCGPGHLMEAFAKRGVSVYGVDISPEAIRRVKERGLEAGLFDLTKPGT